MEEFVYQMDFVFVRLAFGEELAKIVRNVLKVFYFYKDS
jgi:hypothetical protein